MPTPLKKSFNILNTSPNYPSCHKYYSLFISSDLFCSVRLVYTLNKKNLSARVSNEILWDNYTINDEQNLTLLFCDHHRSVLYCFCYRHLARPRMRLLRLCWMLHLLRWKEIMGFFLPGLLQSEALAEVSGVISTKLNTPVSIYWKNTIVVPHLVFENNEEQTQSSFWIIRNLYYHERAYLKGMLGSYYSSTHGIQITRS